MADKLEFRHELEQLINAKSLESGSNTPDFILCGFLMDALAAFDRAVNAREQWYGKKDMEDKRMTGQEVQDMPDGLAITALKLILRQQRALKGTSGFDNATYSIAYFTLNHLGRLNQERDSEAEKLIMEATELLPREDKE